MRVWQREVWITLLSMFSALVIGGLTGYWLPILLALALIFLCRQVYQINRFERWIRMGAKEIGRAHV